MASAGGIRMGKVFVEIGADSSKFFAAIEGINRQVGKIGASMSKVGSQMMTVGAAMAAPFALAGRSAAQFQDALLNISASTGATSQQLQQIRTAAMQMSEALGVGPTEAAQGFLELLKAGMPVEQVLGGAGKAAMEFAKVGQMAVADAAVVMADAMKVFGVDAGTAANTISAAADASSTSIQLLSQSFAQTGAVAALANQSIESTATALALLANAGIKGSDAGTSLKTMLMKLMSPSSDAAQALASVGLSTQSFRGADGKMKPLAEMIDVLSDALGGMDQAAKDDIFRRVFGSDAIRAAAVLTSVGSQGFMDMQQSMAGALPVGEKYKQLMSGLSGSFAAAVAAGQRLAITVGDALAPSIGSFLSLLSKSLEAVKNFAADNQQLVVTVAQGIASFFAAGVAIWTVGKTLSAVSAVIAPVLTGFGVLTTVIGAVLSPVGLLVAAIAGIIAISPQVQSVLGSAFAGLGAILSPIGDTLRETFGPVLQAGIDLMGQLAGTATTTFQGIYEAIAAGDLMMAMDILWAGLYAGWLRGVATLMNAVDPWIGSFQNVFTYLGSSIAIAWDQMWTALATNDFGAIILGAFDNIVNGVMATVDWLVGNIQKAWIRINGFISGAKDTKAQLDAVDAKNKANAAERGRTRPGIEGRRRAAAQDADKIRAEARARQDAIRGDAQATKDERAAVTAANSGARNQAAAIAEARTGQMSTDARDKRILGNQTNDLIASVDAAQSIDELTALAQEFFLLKDAGGVTKDQESKYLAAIDSASDRIMDPAASTQANKPDPEMVRKAAEDAAAASSETAGTFSAFAAQGMGFGNSLQERIAKASEETAHNTRKMSEGGLVDD